MGLTREDEGEPLVVGEVQLLSQLMPRFAWSQGGSRTTRGRDAVTQAEEAKSSRR